MASDNIKYDGDGDGVNDYGILIPDLTLSIVDNARSWESTDELGRECRAGYWEEPKTAVADDFMTT
ncbi:MAG: hypothetical protein HS124_05020 [Anaerolineales bacterium]|nr:hypothetical protein [Anaerolineales bacterium]